MRKRYLYFFAVSQPQYTPSRAFLAGTFFPFLQTKKKAPEFFRNSEAFAVPDL